MTPTILVAADGGPAGVSVFRMARALAEREGARVEVLAIHDPGALRIVRGDDPQRSLRPPPAEVAVRTLRERVRAQLQQVGGAVEDWPLTVQVGGVARTIASYALDCAAGRVLVGLDDTDTAQHWLVREMLLDLIRRLNVPVLAVPRGYEELPRNVVVAVDLSRHSLEIAREAMEDLEPGAQLHLVHVTPRREVPARTDHLAVERQLTELATELELPGTVAVEAHMRVGDPADEILHVAELVDAELIAAGSHGVPVPGQVITGDVYGKLVHLSRRPLLIGPPRGLRLPRRRSLEEEEAVPRAIVA